MPKTTLEVTLGTARLVSQLRIIARHVTALADELEAPDGPLIGYRIDGKVYAPQDVGIVLRTDDRCPECHAPSTEHHRPECTRTCGRCST